MTSPRKVCLSGRKVTLFRFEGARREAVGTAETDADGKWGVRARLTEGIFQAAVAPATKKKTKRHKHKCQGGISARMRL